MTRLRLMQHASGVLNGFLMFRNFDLGGLWVLFCPLHLGAILFLAFAMNDNAGKEGK